MQILIIDNQTDLPDGEILDAALHLIQHLDLPSGRRGLSYDSRWHLDDGNAPDARFLFSDTDPPEEYRMLPGIVHRPEGHNNASKDIAMRSVDEKEWTLYANGDWTEAIYAVRIGSALDACNP